MRGGFDHTSIPLGEYDAGFRTTRLRVRGFLESGGGRSIKLAQGAGCDGKLTHP